MVEGGLEALEPGDLCTSEMGVPGIFRVPTLYLLYMVYLKSPPSSGQASEVYVEKVKYFP